MNFLCSLATIVALLINGWITPYVGGEVTSTPAVDAATLAPGETADPAATALPDVTGDPSVTIDPAATAAPEYHSLTAEQAKARMDSGDEVIILDVRTTTEYEESHIPNAILIPNELIGKNPPSQLPDKNAEILVYCRSGNRSKEAAEKLVDMGYTRIYDFGGINDWPYDKVN